MSMKSFLSTGCNCIHSQYKWLLEACTSGNFACSLWVMTHFYSLRSGTAAKTTDPFLLGTLQIWSLTWNICVFFFLSFFFFFSLSILVIKMYWLEKLSICVSKIHNDSEVSIIHTSSREFWFENTDFNKLWSRELRKRQKWRTQWACASEVLILCTLPEGRFKGDPTEGLPDHHSQEWYSATGPYWNHKWHTITTPRLPWAF